MNQTDVFTHLREWLLSVAPEFEVIRRQSDNVTMPIGDFISMTDLSSNSISLPQNSYVDDGEDQYKITETTVVMTVQLDVWGATSFDIANIINAQVNGNTFNEWLDLNEYAMQSLFCSNFTNVPLTDDDNKWLSRHMMTVQLQYTTVTSSEQPYFDAVQVIAVIANQ